MLPKKELSYTELGALLEVVGAQMKEAGLSFGAALDGAGDSTKLIANGVFEAIGSPGECSEERALEIARLTFDEAIDLLSN